MSLRWTKSTADPTRGRHAPCSQRRSFWDSTMASYSVCSTSRMHCHQTLKVAFFMKPLPASLLRRTHSRWTGALPFAYYAMESMSYCWFASIVCAKQGILPSRRHSCWSFSGHDVHITEARGSSRTIRWITSASHGQSVDYPVYRHVCEKTEHQNADVTTSSIKNIWRPSGSKLLLSLLLASISKQ